MERAAKPGTQSSSAVATPPAAIMDTVKRAIDAQAGRPGALLPLLHALQDELGHVPDVAVAPIAKALNLSRAEVHGTISFYHHFRTRPAGRHIVRICQAEACRSMGCERLMAHAQHTLGCAPHATCGDASVTLEPVYCLGQCANAPTIQIDDRVHARMTPQRFDLLIAALPGSKGES